MAELAMEIRSVDDSERTVTGIVAPYDEISYMTPDPAGERIMRGCFHKSIEQRGNKVRLFVAHDSRAAAIGHATEWLDDGPGLSATFTIGPGQRADQALEDLRNDNYGGMSVGFRPLVQRRGDDGVREIHEAVLAEVSLVGVPAYANAQIIAVRVAAPIFDLPPRPAVNLSPIPAVWLYDSGRS